MLLTMRCVVIVGPYLQDVEEQIRRAKDADLLEWRLDLFQECSIADLSKIRKSLSCPVIFTGMKEEHFQLEPDYIDSPEGPDIISYHNFEEMPNLAATLHLMRQKKASYYKLACHAKSTIDALKLACFAKEEPDVIAIAMGEHGVITRLLAKPWTYVALDETLRSAPGQLTLQDPLGKKNIYGLIGGRVDQSPSFYTHNKFMESLCLDACYVKMALQKEELAEFFPLAQKLGIKGLSVTMPLKEAVIPYLDVIDSKAKEIGAVNTIVFQEGHLIGYNTDADAALDVLEERGAVLGKKMVILGAGGAAKAIAYEAEKRGASVVVVYRATPPQDYDILVNTTPISPEVSFIPGSLVMDIRSYPLMTPFLEKAFIERCSIISGFEMFVNQALRQFYLWGLIKENSI